MSPFGQRHGIVPVGLGHRGEVKPGAEAASFAGQHHRAQPGHVVQRAAGIEQRGPVSGARAALWQAGVDYAHGTGHGVGSFLAVHEGPQRIAKGAGGQPGTDQALLLHGQRRLVHDLDQPDALRTHRKRKHIHQRLRAIVRFHAQHRPATGQRLLMGDALVNEDDRLQVRINQLFDRIEATDFGPRLARYVEADLGVLQRLPKLVPPAVAREMAYTGDRVGAERALARETLAWLRVDTSMVPPGKLARVALRGRMGSTSRFMPRGPRWLI